MGFPIGAAASLQETISTPGTVLVGFIARVSEAGIIYFKVRQHLEIIKQFQLESTAC